MNQFKKAKQKAQESGKQTESITDIKTAGINPNNNTILETNTTLYIEETPTDIDSNIIDVSINESSIQETNEEKKGNTIDSIISETDISNTDTLETHTSTIEETSKILNEQANISQTSLESHISKDPVSEQMINIHPNIYSETKTTNIIKTEPMLEKNTNTEVISNELTILTASQKPDTSIENLPVTPNPVNITVPPNIQQQPSHEVTSAPKSKTNNKKNIPNIFAPKGEAKSMRKSLVLKPTSVKIAENYCTKNGGSFNELIQTLLDNFIEEYGL